MKKILIYDLPTRIFHWLFSVLFVVAFLITKTIDDDNPLFSYHMLAGLILGWLVVLRIVWGFIGTRYAKFSSFALKPSELLEYFKGILSGDKKKWIGDNPASSWAALVMLGSATFLAFSGILMTSGYKKLLEDAHEIVANIFLITVLLHIAGIILHSFRHQDAISVTMLNGKKCGTEKDIKILSSKPLTAIIFLVLVFTFVGYLIQNYNVSTSELNLFGKNLTLIEKDKDKDKDKDHDKNDYDD